MFIVTVHGNRHISLQPDTIYHGFSTNVLVWFLWARAPRNGSSSEWRTATMLNGHLPVAVPSAWNSLPDYVRDTSFSLSVFRSKLNHLYADYQTLCALEVTRQQCAM